MNPFKRLCVVAILLEGLYPDLPGVAAEAVVTPEDLAVLAAVAGDAPALGPCKAGSEPVVVFDIPAVPPRADADRESRMGLPAHLPLRAEVTARSSDEGRWPHVDLGALGACARVIPGSQGNGGARWVKVSWPGFSPDRTQALVYVLSGPGGRFRVGEYIALTKSESGWVIAQRYLQFMT